MEKIWSGLLTPVWHWLLYGGVDEAGRADKAQVYILNVYILLAVVSLVGFGVVHTVGGDDFLGRLELAGSLAMGLAALGLRVTHNTTQTRTHFLLTILVMLFVMLVTGGTEGTGIFWFYVFPVVTFFLAGRDHGLWWMSGLYLMILAVALLAKTSVIEIPYAFVTLRQLLVSLSVVTVGIYVYQGTRENAKREAQGIDRAKSEFVALASHQLRTPISAVSWFAEMLLSGDTGKLTQEQRKDIEQIYQSNQRMGVLIRDMLIVSSLELGTLPIKPARSDMVQLARSVVEEIRTGYLGERKLTIGEDYASSLPSLSVDPEIVRIILRNLLSNAVKYTPDSGHVHLRLSETQDKVQRSSRGSLCIEVQDNGHGIPLEAQKNIFTKFFRATNVKDKDTDGTGLGLYIVKQLIDHIGGTITFTSNENVGTLFVILLPLEGMKRTEAHRKL